MVNKLENLENILQYHMMIFTFNVIPNVDDLDTILFTRHYNIKYNLKLNNKYICPRLWSMNVMQHATFNRYF